MALRALFVCCVVLMFGQSAFAQENGNKPGPKEKQIFEDCLTKAGPLFADRMQCVGKTFDFCSSTPEQSSTIGMRECYSREAALWEMLIEQAERNASKLLEDGNKKIEEDVAKAAADLLAFRETACAIPADLHAGGTIGSLLAVECYNRVTAFWALMLDDFATPMGN